MADKVGLSSVPDDANLIEWLNSLYVDANNELLDYLKEWNEVVDMTKEDNDPIEWAYARLLNNLSSLDNPKLIRMLSAFIWNMSPK